MQGVKGRKSPINAYQCDVCIQYFWSILRDEGVIIAFLGISRNIIGVPIKMQTHTLERKLLMEALEVPSLNLCVPSFLQQQGIFIKQRKPRFATMSGQLQEGGERGGKGEMHFQPFDMPEPKPFLKAPLIWHKCSISKPPSIFWHKCLIQTMLTPPISDLQPFL